MEYVRSLSERPEFIGGIDNEALDFDHLDRYMQSVTSVRSHPESSHETNDTIALPAAPGPTLVDNVALTPVTGTADSSITDGVYRPVDLRGLRLITVHTDESGLAKPVVGDVINETSIHEGNENEPKKDCYVQYSDDALAIEPKQNIAKSVRLPESSGELNSISDLHLYHNSSLLSANHFRHHNHHDQQPASRDAVFIGTEGVTEPIAVEKDLEMAKKRTNVSPSSHFPEESLFSQQSIGIAIFDGDCNSSQTHLLNLDSNQATTIETQNVITDQFTAAEPISGPMSVSEMINSSSLTYKRKRKFDATTSSDIKPEPDTSTFMSFNSNCRQQRFQQRQQANKNISPIDAPRPIAEANIDINAQNLVVPDTSTLQCIRFAPFEEQNWHVLCDQYLKDIPVPNCRVDADKGFNFSNADDAFVCQKKNHFQITCHIQLQGDAKFVRSRSGLEKIKFFQIHFYGVKLEAPNHRIRVEQSQSDRSKKPFHPVPYDCLAYSYGKYDLQWFPFRIDLEKGVVRKVTVGRLHFSETTSNNMRKKGRPNPEQRYFQLVVSLHAHTYSGSYPLVSHGSERIIVRASNPGQFDSDVEFCWQHGVNDSIFHVGHVGINTDRPDESLVVHGNLKISGHIVQPSDSRVKKEIHELDTAQQMKNLQKIRIVEYKYQSDYATHAAVTTVNSNDVFDIGVIAQEVRQVLPDAVKDAGDVILPSGRIIKNFLLVNKERIFMESIGAVKELCRINESLQKRVKILEEANLYRYSNFDPGKIFLHMQSNRVLRQIFVIWMILTAIGLTASLTVYTYEHRKRQNSSISDDTVHLNSSGFNISEMFINSDNVFNCHTLQFFVDDESYRMEKELSRVILKLCEIEEADVRRIVLLAERFSEQQIQQVNVKRNRGISLKINITYEPYQRYSCTGSYCIFSDYNSLR